MTKSSAYWSSLANWHSLRPAGPFQLKGFTLKAVIDWIEFSVTLHSPSQFRHVQNRVREVWGKVHFTPDQGVASSRSFTFRLNNPPGPDQFMRELQSMARPGDPAITEQDVIVKGIEIALDAYVEGSDRQTLAQAVSYLIRHQANPPAGSPRITANRCTPVEPESIQDILDALLQGGITINCGAMGADRTCRFYLKDYDTIHGVPYASLHPEQWRARFENTLQGKEVLFTSIDGWRNHRFERSMADMFALVIPDSARSDMVALMQARLVQIGRRPDSPKIRRSDRRQRRAGTRRDIETNDKIRQALRALTRAQACQNSVTNQVETQRAPLERVVFVWQAPKYGIPSLGSQFTSAHSPSFTQSDKSLLTTDMPQCKKASRVAYAEKTKQWGLSQGIHGVNVPARFAPDL